VLGYISFLFFGGRGDKDILLKTPKILLHLLEINLLLAGLLLLLLELHAPIHHTLQDTNIRIRLCDQTTERGEFEIRFLGGGLLVLVLVLGFGLG